MDTRLQEYAQLAVTVGINLKKGQPLVIRTPVECAPFARLCAEVAYEAGAREVIVDYTDSTFARMRYLHADDAVFDGSPSWFSDKFNMLAAEGAAFLTFTSDDPDMLRGVDPDRIQRNQKATGAALLPYYDAVSSNRIHWCVIGVPTLPWAAKVFPHASEREAIEALWEAVYQTVRITGDGKAVERWQAHVERLQARAQTLNALQLTSVHYQNELGTDLTVGLPDGAYWAGGAEAGPDGVPFVANMPTEELFTAPHRDRVNGRVVSSMPFVLNGNVIHTFTLTFQDGKIVKVETEDARQRELLENAVRMDEGASHLGEVALVPFDSPIAELGILFYNTLYDENASCHFAFGKAYPCIEGAEEMDREQLLAAGINESITHQDFMVGTRDLRITGQTKDGRSVPIFVDGNFAL